MKIIKFKLARLHAMRREACIEIYNTSYSRFKKAQDRFLYDDENKSMAVFWLNAWSLAVERYRVAAQ